jgi:NAD+ synthetase
MRLALFQFNPLVGAVEKNAARIRDAAQRAQQEGAELMLAPELALCGYSPKDILIRGDLLGQMQVAAAHLARTSPIPLLLGAAAFAPSNLGTRVFNVALLCRDGKVDIAAKKTLLPNYDVFDEVRYFHPAEPDQEAAHLVEIGGCKLGISICEDGWNDAEFWPEARYGHDPIHQLAKNGATALIQLAASPYRRAKLAFREELLAHLAKRHGLPLLMAGQVGANDHLIFDGSSVALDAKGQAVARAEAFAEDLIVVDLQPDGSLSAVEGTTVAPRPEDLDADLEALRLGIRDYVHKCRCSGVLLGLSGGVDSALVAALAAQALGPENVHGVRMPSAFSSDHSLSDAEALAKNLGIQLSTIAIEDTVESLRKGISETTQQMPENTADITDQNLQARARGLILMALSNRSGDLVLATGNKSELAVGYATLYGDMCGALMPIADVYKTDVWALCRHMNRKSEAAGQGEIIPRAIIDKVPSAELKPDQTDQDSLPEYTVLDAILQRYVDADDAKDRIVAELDLPEAEVDRVLAMVNRSEYKRWQAPPTLRVTGRAFGEGRRWPLAKGFNP